MNEENWVAIIEDEDRLIANSDRRFRYHCYSLENMSEELTYQERSLYVQEDFTSELLIQDFIDTVRNEKLAFGLRRLTDRQRRAIELAFWEGYQYKEIATVFQCSPAAVTLLLQESVPPALEISKRIVESKGSIPVILPLLLPIQLF